jgi:hypothetical protein
MTCRASSGVRTVGTRAGRLARTELMLRENRSIDPRITKAYSAPMKAVEFTTELRGSNVLEVPSEAAARLPKAGRARVIVLTDEANEEAEWRLGTSEQVLREDAPEDAIYDTLH